MVRDLIECYVWGFIAPAPFFFVWYVVGQLKKYFTTAADIKED